VFLFYEHGPEHGNTGGHYDDGIFDAGYSELVGEM
jgi:hypothetical protein